MASASLIARLDSDGSVPVATNREMTPTGDTDHGACLLSLSSSDQPYLACANGNKESKYVERQSPGDVPIGSTINSVSLSASFRFSILDACTVLGYVLSDALVRADDTPQVVPYYQDVAGLKQGIVSTASMTVNPVTGVAWTLAELFSYQWGFEVTGQTGTLYYKTLTVDIDYTEPAPVIPVTITPTSLPAGTTGVAYSQQLTGHGGDAGPYTFAVFSGTLPSGVTLSTGGLLSGTPTAGASLSPSSLPGATVDVEYSQQLSVVADVVSTFTVRATDGSANTGDQAYTLTVDARTAPYTYALVEDLGVLPVCMVCSVLGLITGTPYCVGVWTFTIRATDALGVTTDRAYTFTATS